MIRDKGIVKTEGDMIANMCFRMRNQLVVNLEDVYRIARVARIRGIIEGSSKCGCGGTADINKKRLKSLLNNKQYRKVY